MSPRDATSPAPGHPLATTFARGYGRIHRSCHLGARIGPAGRPVAQLTDVVGDEQALKALLAAVGRDVGSRRRDVQASLLLDAYAWTLMLPLAGALLLERRVPVLDTGTISVTLRAGAWPDELVLATSAFAGLPDDPDAGHPDLRTAASPEELVTILRAQVVAHLETPVRELSAFSRRSRRALWRSVADRTAGALLFAGEVAGDLESAACAASRLLGGGAPLTGRPDYRRVVTPQGPVRAHVRAGCCLWWRTRAGGPCLTCPLSAPLRRRTAA